MEALGQLGTKPQDKAQYIEALSRLDADTLRILAELAKKPGIEKKLKDKLPLIKAFL